MSKEALLITDKDIVDFFDGNEHILFIAKRYGFFFDNDEDLQEAKNNALMAALRAKDRGKEFNDYKHLYYYMAGAARSGISRVFSKRRQLKYIDIKYQRDFRKNLNDDSSIAYENLFVSNDKEYDGRIDYIKTISRKVLSVRQRDILSLYLEGYSNSDIDKALGMSRGNGRNSISRIIKKLKKTKNGNETSNKQKLLNSSRRVQAKHRHKPSTQEKISSERRIKADRFLDSSEEVWARGL